MWQRDRPRRGATGPPAERPRPGHAAKVRAELTADSDYVGPKFPEEARKIHFDEAPARAIHGEASLEEAHELNQEGTPVSPCRRCRRTTIK